MGALNLLHPELHDGLKLYIKKLQRKVETLELKQTIQGKDQGDRLNTGEQTRVQMLERVNKELKKQLTCYKEEIE